jgi:hypothetical protein
MQLYFFHIDTIIEEISLMLYFNKYIGLGSGLKLSDFPAKAPLFFFCIYVDFLDFFPFPPAQFSSSSLTS